MTYMPTRRRRIRRDGLGGLLDTITSAFASDDQKRMAGCTPLEIVAAAGTPPYDSCLAKVRAVRSPPAPTPAPAPATTTAPEKPSGLAALIGGLLSNATKPATPAPVYAQPSSGMSTTTMLALGALGLGIVYVATK